jgi:hypothetical protein
MIAAVAANKRQEWSLYAVQTAVNGGSDLCAVKDVSNEKAATLIPAAVLSAPS